MTRRSLAWLDQERETHLLGLMRLGFAMLLFLQPAKALLAYRSHGTFFGNVFHIPVLPESWVPSDAVYSMLLIVQATAAALAFLGVFSRPALLLAACIGFYFLCLNRLDYHNNRYALYLLAFLMAFTPCDRSFTVRSFESRGGKGPIWAVRFLGLQVSLIYSASAFGKLLDADWRSGQVLHVRYERALDYLAREGLASASFLEPILTSPAFAELTSKCAILTELFLALGLWLRPTRALALYCGLVFHVAIELIARVEAFSFIMLTAYLAFVVPELEERELVVDLRSSRARRVARAVRALDWFRRFRRTERTLESNGETPYYAVDREGSVHDGFRGLVLLSRGLPLLFPFWGPLAAIAWLRSLTKQNAAPNAKPD